MDDRPLTSCAADQPTTVIVVGRVPPGVRPWLPPAEGGSAPATAGLGHFDVLETLGRGGNGVVVRAFDRKLRREVAIKLMAAELAATSPARKRFVREARAAAAVRHENVVQIYAVEEADTPYLVMEYVPGTSLHQYLSEHGPLGVAEVLRAGVQIARGLAAAHDRGLVHRDVKPGNILVERFDGLSRVKLTDFGIAQAADDASLTHSGTVVGTPMYMSPEQARGEPVDHRSDLYSLGSVLYEMVAGRPPFRAANSLAVLKRVADEEPRPIRAVMPETPDWLCAIIAKLQARRPDDRFQSARDVADLLDDCLAAFNQAVSVRLPAGLMRRRTRRWAGAAAALAACGLLCAGGYILATDRATPPPPPPGLVEKEPAPPPAVNAQDANRDTNALGVAFVRVPPGPARPETGPLPAAVAAELATELRRRNPQFRGDIGGKVVDGRVRELWIDNVADLTDLTAVGRYRELEVLVIHGAQASNLGPLRGLPLRHLNVNGNTALTDLGPLRGMPLERLAAWGFQGDDLSPLAGMPLTHLNCGGGGKKLDLAPLKGMPLVVLGLNVTAVDDLTPLKGMPLDQLMIGPTRVTDLTPLAGMKITKLHIDGTPVADLTPVRDLPLEVLDLDFDAERDARILRAMPTLKVINKKPAEKFWADVIKE